MIIKNIKMKKYYLDLKIGDKLSFNTGLEMLIEDTNSAHITFKNTITERIIILNRRSTFFLNEGVRIVYLGKRNRGNRGYILIYQPDGYRYKRIRDVT